jgi:choline kinase
MQAIILAAGFGKRLKPLTDSIPKSLVEVNGTPLLVNTLNLLSDVDVTEAIIVVGHMKEKIIETIGHRYNNIKITYVENPIYDKSNNIYSFWLSKDYVKDDVIMFECDLFYDERLIESICKEEYECSILVSPFDKKTMNGTVIEVTNDNKANALILGKHQKEDFDYTSKYKTVNVYKFKKEFIINKFFPAVDTYIKVHDINSYYEVVLGSLIYFGDSDIRVINIPTQWWCEIDDVNDLKIAIKKFSLS